MVKDQLHKLESEKQRESLKAFAFLVPVGCEAGSTPAFLPFALDGYFLGTFQNSFARLLNLVQIVALSLVPKENDSSGLCYQPHFQVTKLRLRETPRS